ncbi:hypothetical protein [Nodosilinea nodulosa]|uniref:hypothetical protein n=1 Tax=Nodosilinea nodulosa TaxID=416001 RepID=UPI00037A5C00|nr:hypothetical protein [Nodosilinea nodulosa]
MADTPQAVRYSVGPIASPGPIAPPRVDRTKTAVGAMGGAKVPEFKPLSGQFLEAGALG